ncbi:sugar phosphorylase [Glaciecola sp. 2405UD65-10]|uniref:sugar phosphorylase n=1 Tax=Glaciecola sp. 2405UD65-10 TaxID=3397244 RepID=UPI003B5C2BA7
MHNVEYLKEKVFHHLELIYGTLDKEIDLEDVTQELLKAMRLSNEHDVILPEAHANLWSEEDIVLITYGDSLIEPEQNIVDGMKRPPLQTLHQFLHKYCGHAINNVHILPFFPYSSDDGFSVIDYSTVSESLGDWEDVTKIANEFGLMVDLVINHCSARSAWFQNFIQRKEPGKDFFYTSEPNPELDKVTRPRTSPLLRETETLEGTKQVWCTFSHDQVDFDFTNPKVLLAFIEIIRLYLDRGTRIFRFDAIAFLWKELGTNCINLPQTHEMVRLLRTLIEHAAPHALIITETNIPNQENLTYFGNANEAHSIYNFSLPPLLLNTLVTGDCSYLKNWLMSMPPAQNGTFYFNFIASHDGIGLRPAEGLLSDEEIEDLANCMQNFGGKVSWRSTPNGKQKPYELNIALIDALQGDISGADEFQLERFLCAHTIMFGLEGIPGLYIHSLLGTPNDDEKVTHTGQNRSINRHRWVYDELVEELDDVHSLHHQVLTQITQLLAIRKAQSAFHPNATQFTLQLGPQVFGYWRQSIDRRQSIFCISNISKVEQSIRLSDINLIGTENWIDLLSQKAITSDLADVILQPYQSMWISNKY